MNVVQGLDPTKSAYLNPCEKSIRTNDQVKDDLGINNIIPIKGVNGETPKPVKPGSNIPTKQFVCIVGVPDNTHVMRRQLGNKLVKYLNERATTLNYKWPKETIFWADRTTNPKRKISSVMLDANVFQIIEAAYEGTPIQDLKEFPEIVAEFWQDTQEGYKKMSHYGI